MDRASDDSSISTIAFDNVEAAATATCHLVEHGHRPSISSRVRRTSTSAASRIAGWHAALEEAAFGRPPDASPFTYEGGRKAAGLLLARRELPTAVMVASDVQAIGVISVSCGARDADSPSLALVSVDGTRAPHKRIRRLPPWASRRADGATRGRHHRPRDEEPVHVVMCGSLTLRRYCGC
jgi:LacI family transcriptional regulator